MADFNLTRDEVLAQTPVKGLGRILYCEKADFDTIAQLPASPTTNAEYTTISDAHTFTGTNGFREMFFDSDRSNLGSESIGGKYTSQGKTNMEFFIPGAPDGLLALLRRKPDMIFLVYGSNCGGDAGVPWQLGTYCKGVEYDAAAYAGGTTEVNDEDPGFTLTISSIQSTHLIKYSGAVTMATA